MMLVNASYAQQEHDQGGMVIAAKQKYVNQGKSEALMERAAAALSTQGHQDAEIVASLIVLRMR